MASVKQNRRERDELRKRRDAIREARGRLFDESAKLRAQIEKKRDKRQEAEFESRREDLADQIDSLVGEEKRVNDRLEALDARLGDVNAALRRVGKAIKRGVKRLRRKRFYASKHFRYDEFDCNDGTPVPKSAHAALRHLCQNYLEPLRAKYGTVHINSGYRHAAYNRLIGGALYSIHIYDNNPDAVAADHTCAGASPGTVYSFEDDLDPGGLGRYLTFTHVDNRQRIGWATARWSG